MSSPASEAPDFRTREVVDADWDKIADLIDLYEFSGITGDVLRERQLPWNNADPRLRLVVLDDAGSIIGYCRSMSRSSEPQGIFRMSVYVDPQWAGKGMGRFLLAITEGFVKEHGGIYPMSTVEETCKRGLEFAERAGYSKVQHLFESRLDLVGFDAAPYQIAQACLEDEGFRFATLEELGISDENWKTLWELDTITDRDTPGSELWGIGSLEEYRARHEGSAGFSPANMHIATVGGKWIGVNMVKESPVQGEMHTDYTGVLRAYRGRGLAQVLKVLGIQRAIDLGATTIVTNNDERNVPMLAINKKLGFQVQPGFYVVKKDWSTTISSGA